MSVPGILIVVVILVVLVALAFGAGDRIDRRGGVDRDLDGETDGRED